MRVLSDGRAGGRAGRQQWPPPAGASSPPPVPVATRLRPPPATGAGCPLGGTHKPTTTPVGPALLSAGPRVRRRGDGGVTVRPHRLVHPNPRRTPGFDRVSMCLGSPVERAFRWKLDGDSTGKRSMGLDGDSPSNKTSRHSSQRMTFLVTRTICRVSRPPARASRNLLELSLDDHKADSIAQTNG